MGTVIFIGGPTASGKSSLGMELAERLGTVILSADSRQVYRRMDIVTAKPTAEEQARVPHYLIDIREPEETYDVGQFEADASQLLEDLLNTYPVVLVVGGTGLYLRALRFGLDTFPAVPKDLQTRLRQVYDQEGITALQDRLRKVDPIYAQEVDLSNPQRLIRAIAVSEHAGRPYSSFRSNALTHRPYRILPILLEPHRQWLYQRTDQRILHMVEDGLVEEARLLYPYRHLDALKTVGLQELFEWMSGECTFEEAIARFQQNTRRFAKRQLTWFRKETDWHRFDPETDPGIVDKVLALLKEG